MTIKQLDEMLKVLDKRYKAFEDICNQLYVQYQHEEGIEMIAFQINDSDIIVNSHDEKKLNEVYPLINMYLKSKESNKHDD